MRKWKIKKVNEEGNLSMLTTFHVYILLWMKSLTVFAILEICCLLWCRMQGCHCIFHIIFERLKWVTDPNAFWCYVTKWLSCAKCSYRFCDKLLISLHISIAFSLVKYLKTNIFLMVVHCGWTTNGNSTFLKHCIPFKDSYT